MTTYDFISQQLGESIEERSVLEVLSRINIEASAEVSDDDLNLLFASREIKSLSKYNFIDKPSECKDQSKSTHDEKKFESSIAVYSIERIDKKLEKERMKLPLSKYHEFVNNASVFRDSDLDIPELLASEYNEKKDFENALKVLELTKLYVEQGAKLFNGQQLALEIAEAKKEPIEDQIINQFNENTILQVRESAKICGVSERTIQNWKETGGFKFVSRGIYIKSLLRYMRENKPRYFNQIIERVQQ